MTSKRPHLAALAHADPAHAALTAATPAGPWSHPQAIPTTLATDASVRFRTVADVVMQAMATHGIPGTSLGNFCDGGEEHAEFGMADLATGEAVGPNTRFQIGSLTKTYTATAIMRLVAAGHVALDAPIRTYLPALDLAEQGVADRLMVRHLLTHTGGWWGDAFVDTGGDGEAIARFVGERLPTYPQIAPLGVVFSYSNAGFIVLGRTIEVITEMEYRAALRSLLLEPLGMTGSTFAGEGRDHTSTAVGYANGPDGV
jgi:CubicO group peptidase (beta-lactamase class C family)